MKRFNVTEIMASLDKEVKGAQHALAQRISGAVVLSTPIGRPDLWQSAPPKGYSPGKARGNWRAALGRAATEQEQDTLDPAGASTIGRMETVIRRWDGRAKLVFSNAAKHIVPLDDGTASRQVSARFVERAVRAAVASLGRDRRELP